MFDHKTVAKALEGPRSCPLLTNHPFGVGQLKHLAHPKDANSTRGVSGFWQKSPSGPDFGDKFFTSHLSFIIIEGG